MGQAVATDAQSACGLDRTDQQKIDATVESAITAGLHQRPETSSALPCEERRQRERFDGSLRPRERTAKPSAGAPQRPRAKRTAARRAQPAFTPPPPASGPPPPLPPRKRLFGDGA